MGYETKAAAVVTAADAAAQLDGAGAEALRGELDALRMELKQDLDGLSRRLVSAPPVMGGAMATRSTAFGDAYLRKGMEAGFESKRMSVGVGGEGGLAVPLEIDQRIETTLKQISPIRALADVVKIGSANYRKLVASGGFASGWVAETAARAETSTPVFSEVLAPMGELYANPAATQAMLDDALFDVEGWLAQEVATEFARAEGVAFVSGSGVSQPKGFLTYPVATAGDATRPFGTLQYVAAGAAGGFVASNPHDKLIDLVHSLRAPYRQGAAWVMNSNTMATVRKFKDSTGDFIWKPGLLEGQASTLLGYPVVEVDAMPDIAANSLSIGFGQFRSAYVIADRGETAVLRDPYSNKPFVHFYATRRVGGALVNSEALKLMRFSAT
ncbi:phage major capsid protein [Sandaracinobacter neustonicus]|uniref:Phage major capsid protein n=1 Tax=Sandaracinobacter neustonicus TaxID=1715348 RepID=A0A501XD63_9SPHN|nr:phage major capsid protein [Sandaracinobacter neustonicus]TPE58511.1 phage major capsid protein [Sandaracinobacter neustonicus]